MVVIRRLLGYGSDTEYVEYVAACTRGDIYDGGIILSCMLFHFLAQKQEWSSTKTCGK